MSRNESLARYEANGFGTLDLDNMFDVQSNPILNDDLGGTQLLYADYRWNSTSSDLVYRGFSKYASGYDGYTFFQ